MRRTVRGVERPRLLFFYPCACATGGPAGANGDGWLGGAASKRESLTPIAGRLPQIEAAASTKTGWDVCVAAAAAGCVAAAAAARRRQGQPPARRRAPHPGPAARPARTIPAPPPHGPPPAARPRLLRDGVPPGPPPARLGVARLHTGTNPGPAATPTVRRCPGNEYGPTPRGAARHILTWKAAVPVPAAGPRPRPGAGKCSGLGGSQEASHWYAAHTSTPPSIVVVNTPSRESGGSSSWFETCSGAWYPRRRPCGVAFNTLVDLNKLAGETLMSLRPAMSAESEASDPGRPGCRCRPRRSAAAASCPPGGPRGPAAGHVSGSRAPP